MHRDIVGGNAHIVALVMPGKAGRRPAPSRELTGKHASHPTVTVESDRFMKDQMAMEERAHNRYLHGIVGPRARDTVAAEPTPREARPPTMAQDAPPSSRLVASRWMPPPGHSDALSVAPPASARSSARSTRPASAAHTDEDVQGILREQELTSRKDALQSELAELEMVLAAKKRQATGFQQQQVSAERPFACFPSSARGR